MTPRTAVALDQHRQKPGPAFQGLKQAVRPLDRADPPAALRALREQINANAETYRTGRLTVVLYALTAPHGDPTDHLGLARQFADHKHATVHAEFSDRTGDVDPALRPGWAKTLRALAHNQANAIVSISRTAISHHPTPHREQLAWLGDHHAALYLLRPETAL
ncbi:hypothetical protein [Streptomyces sp. NPDC059076]|uniref:hypothetical protein n=1 Tax=unclassified Streptomyces TaxID=2593676 RepID=UPI0036917161